MRVTAWSNGKARYGIRVGKKNAREHFQHGWLVARIEMDGRYNTIRLGGNDWTQRAVLPFDEVGEWLQSKGLIPWEKRHPPVLELTPLGNDRFRLSLPACAASPADGASGNEADNSPCPPLTWWCWISDLLLKIVGMLISFIAFLLCLLACVVHIERRLTALTATAEPNIPSVVREYGKPALLVLIALWALRAIARLDSLFLKSIGYAVYGAFFVWLFYYFVDLAPVLTARFQAE